MEQSKKLLLAFIATFNESLQKSGTPNTEQLTRFMQKLTSSLLPMLINAPLDVRNSAIKEFKASGWDANFHSRTKTSAAEFTAPSCLLSMQNVLSLLQHRQLDTIPTETELKHLSLACAKLWDLDTDRLIPDRNYRINIQRGKSTWTEGDIAADPFFTSVDPEVFKQPTFASFHSLLDNYVSPFSSLFSPTLLTDLSHRSPMKGESRK